VVCLRHLLIYLILFVFTFAQSPSTLRSQDGASYNPMAKTYRAPALSLAGATDTPERMAAMMSLYQGDVDESLSTLKQLAEGGDVGSAVFLGSLYRRKVNLPIPVDLAQALHYFKIASYTGSGEGSERIAEMIEEQEISAQTEGGAPFWRNLAVKQGWNEQRLAVYCFDWIHGPEPLHCETHPLPGGNIPPESQQQCPTESEMAILLKQGLTGEIRIDGGAIEFSPGPKARAVLVLDHAVPKEADLMEPDGMSVVYIQTPQDRWRMIPRSAQLLNRFIILKPGGAGVGRTSIGVQAVDGSQTGGACSIFTN
jgi:hypothetical protein